MIAFDLASLSFGTSLLQRLQQFAHELSQRVRKCCLLLSKPTKGQCAYAWETLVVDRRIAGKVTGADGLGAANIQVELVPRRPTQQNQLPFPVAETRTGGDGTYTLKDIRPGEYYLGINLAHTPSKDMPYTRYFLSRN